MKDEKNIIENSKIVYLKNVKKIKLSPYDDVENPLLTWFAAARRAGLPLNGFY